MLLLNSAVLFKNRPNQWQSPLSNKSKNKTYIKQIKSKNASLYTVFLHTPFKKKFSHYFTHGSVNELKNHQNQIGEIYCVYYFIPRKVKQM